MNGVGWGGVIFIWVSFLWPVFAAVVVFVTRKSVSGSFKYWATSIFGGYISVWLIGTALGFIVTPLYQGNPSLLQYFGFFVIVLSFVAPIFVSFYVSKKCS